MPNQEPAVNLLKASAKKAAQLAEQGDIHAAEGERERERKGIWVSRTSALISILLRFHVLQSVELPAPMGKP